MQLARIHQALADPTRLRIVALLLAGPLCVCHFQSVLREPQAKISKHLAILRARGLVAARRDGHWMVYALAEPVSPVVAAVGTAAEGEAGLRRDRERLAKLDLSCSPAAVMKVGARGKCC